MGLLQNSEAVGMKKVVSNAKGREFPSPSFTISYTEKYL